MLDEILLRMIARLIRSKSGSVMVAGERAEAMHLVRGYGSLYKIASSLPWRTMGARHLRLRRKWEGDNVGKKLPLY